MNEKQRQQGLDTLRQEQAAIDDAFDQIAMTIARADIPVSHDPASRPTPEERDASPADWINNYAEGLARSGRCSHDEAAAGIRTAFEERYRMSPEAYAELYSAQQAITDEVREALAAASTALDNLALERALPPDAERARDLCRDALESIEHSRDDSQRRRSVMEKDDAVARAIDKVKNKEEEQRQRESGDQERGERGER